MLNTGYSDYTNEDIINGSLLNTDSNKIHHNTTNVANDKNKNYFHLCHICGNGFPKASIPSHQKMCMKKHFARPNQLSAASFLHVNNLKNQILYNNSPTYPCSNCLEQVPYNKLSSHIRTCKGLHSNANGKHLEKLNVESVSSMSLSMSNGKLNQLNLLPPISSNSNSTYAPSAPSENGGEISSYPNNLMYSSSNSNNSSNRNSMVLGHDNSYPFYTTSSMSMPGPMSMSMPAPPLERSQSVATISNSSNFDPNSKFLKPMRSLPTIGNHSDNSWSQLKPIINQQQQPPQPSQQPQQQPQQQPLSSQNSSYYNNNNNNNTNYNMNKSDPSQFNNGNNNEYNGDSTVSFSHSNSISSTRQNSTNSLVNDMSKMNIQGNSDGNYSSNRSIYNDMDQQRSNLPSHQNSFSSIHSSQSYNSNSINSYNNNNNNMNSMNNMNNMNGMNNMNNMNGMNGMNNINNMNIGYNNNNIMMNNNNMSNRNSMVINDMGNINPSDYYNNPLASQQNSMNINNNMNNMNNNMNNMNNNMNFNSNNNNYNMMNYNNNGNGNSINDGYNSYSRVSSASKGVVTSVPSVIGVNEQEEVLEIKLEPCPICNRTFAVDGLSRHITACQKGQKKRKVFNASQARAKGTDLEKFMKEKKTEELISGVKEQPIKPAKKTTSWRVKHERFINMIRAAKGPSKKKPSATSASTSSSSNKVEKKEKKEITPNSSFSLPKQEPPQEASTEIDIYEDYVTCPSCNRRFDAQVAERHMPKCKEIKARSLLHQLNNKSSAKVEAGDYLKKRMSYKPPPVKSKKKGKAAESK